MKYVFLNNTFHGNGNNTLYIYNELEAYLKISPATGIIGPRQVGKTVFTKQIIAKKKHLYINTEHSNGRDKLIDPAFFYSKFPDHIIIFEKIQFMPELFTAFRRIIDTNKISKIYNIGIRIPR